MTPFFTSTPSSGTPSPYTGTSDAVTLPTVAGETVVQYRARAYNPANHFTDAFVNVNVVPTVDIATATATDFAVLRTGALVVDTPRSFAGLIVLRGATITHTAATGPGGEHATSLTVSGPFYVECGGAVDASGKGYPVNKSYPGATVPADATGGSHLGYGGFTNNPLGSTFGSVYRPQEAGGGAGNGGTGGGIVRIAAGSVTVDGAIRANGVLTGPFNDRGGAGGSVWITAASVGGGGTIEVHGGDNSSWGSGGGGAIAIEYASTSGTVLNNLVARTGSPAGGNRYGGAGTVYLKGPAAVYGDLAVDNLGVAIVQATDLPSLGSGVAQAGSAGATLVTDRAVDVPAYFAGHWVEVSDSSNVKKGVWRIGTILAKTVTLLPNASETISILPGDRWQGVYLFDNVTLKGARLLSTDPIRATATQIQGVVEVKRIDSTSLTVKAGATLTHLVPAVGSAETLALNVTGALTVEAGGAIDVSGRGYTSNKSYPGATVPADATGGSHLGYGGFTNNPLGSTFGSVYRPQEAGGGAGNGGTGGGIVRIAAGSVTVDGAIRANGVLTGPFNDRGGAGGSVWITAASVGGGGTIEVHGGDNSSWGSGGGGAIAIEYASTSGTVLNNLVARTGSPAGGNRYGGAGTVYLKGAAAVYGTLTLDNGGRTGQATALPSLGSGVAQAGSTGATLVTDRASDIPAYFAGHWVEISDPSSVLKGTCRISTAAGGIVAKTVTLDSCSSAFTVSPSDKWQGVYRFDDLVLRNGANLASADPVHTSSSIVLDGSVVDTLSVTGSVEVRNAVTARRIDAQSLTVKAGGSLTQFGTSSTAETLTLNVAGALTVEAGGAIDVSGRGYTSSKSYPGATVPADATGGSHLGYGGFTNNPLGSTFGSVYRPQEAGGGAGNGGTGGGIVRIAAGSVTVDGAIRANGVLTGPFNDRGGAGGSVWITAASVGGGGTIEVHGGDNSSWGSGGGGAIAIEYASTSGTVLNNLVARTGSPAGGNRYGGAGTVYLKGPAAVYGDLAVDNLGVAIVQATDLPSLGSGVAQAGSAGAALVTDRAVDVPAYFAGHWVEVSDSSNVKKGVWRIGTILAKTVTLLPNASETISILPGDRWQGVYLFDNVTLKGARLLSTDPIRATATQIQGVVEVKRIDSTSLTVKAGATLTHLVPAVGSAETLALNVTGALTVEAGGAIDVSGRGYTSNKSYPGATVPADATGGSHLGYGGFTNNPLGSTFGSVYRPQEAGGGAGNGGTGGGIVRIAAGSVTVDGAIRANGVLTGPFNDRGGAGGSVWITAASVGGGGTIEVHGGDNSSWGSGGGGAIAIEYASTSGTVLNNLVARTGSPAGGNRYGGAGTVYLKGAAAVYGTLTLDNGGRTGQATALPSLGSGVAQAGSTGATLVTDRAVDIPAYFAGHWVEVRDSTGTTLKGTWRISTAAGGIAAKTVTLAPNGAETISVVAGDQWQGVYRFDAAPTVTGNATLSTVDPIRIGGALARVESLPAFAVPAPFAIRSLSLCSDLAAPLKPGSSFVACADVNARDVTLEISGAFEARVDGYGNCRTPVAIPGSARPGPLKIVATARDTSGRTASAVAHALVVADERAPVLVSVMPASGQALRSGDPLRVAVETWDDVGVASVAFSIGGSRTLLTSPPFEVDMLAPPVASAEVLPILVEVFDPSGNVSRRTLDLSIRPAGAPLPLSRVDVPRPGVSLEGGTLSVDGGWPWRDADGETRGRTLELPAIGTHAVLGADGETVTLDGQVARPAVHGGAVDVRRGDELVGRFRILSVSEDGTALRLEAGAAGRVREGDFLEGVWSFDEVALTRGARLVSGDVVDAQRLRVDASSLFLSRKIRIPGSDPAPSECASRGPRPDPPGTPPASAGGVAP